jgi:hypothetical protein
MSDVTEPYRRQRLAEINIQPGSREALEAQYGQVWNTEELRGDFGVTDFLAPLSWFARQVMCRMEVAASDHQTLLKPSATPLWSLSSKTTSMARFIEPEERHF